MNQPLTRQQLFDNALNGIRAQGHRASGTCEHGDYFECLYIAPSGDRCAIGHSIPESITYDQLDELGVNSNTAPSTLVGHLPELERVFNGMDTSWRFLSDLQAVHDNIVNHHDAEQFESEMAELAQKCELVYTPRKVIA